MSTAPIQEVLLGCTSPVRVVIIEDAGNLVIQVFATDPDNTDIDGLFFNLVDDSVSADLTIFPAVDLAEVTGFDVATGTLNQLNNGAQIQEAYDVRVEFGDLPSTSQGDIDQAAFTLFLDGEMPLTAGSIDLANMTAVVNSDSGNGLALTNAAGATPELRVVATEDFDGLHAPEDSAIIASDDHWQVQNGQALTHGHADGTLTLAPVDTDGPVTLSFDIRGENLDRFEASGHYADSIAVEVRLDNGDWITLDTFVINEATDTFTGDQTGQTFGGDLTTLTYSGGALDGAQDSAEFRIVSDISASDERILIDNIEVSATEDSTAPQIVETTVVSEDFAGLHEADDSAAIVSDARWDVRHDAAFTNGCNDGRLVFEEIATDGNVELSFDAQGINLHNFEATGRYADTLEVQVQIDGGDWVTLDEFRINHAGNALVGDQTGQEITHDPSALNYSGGVLDSASDSVQFRLVSDISANNEAIRIDNVEIRTIEEVAAGDETCEEFEIAASGDVAADQFEGFTVTGQRAGDAADSENDAMVFDTSAPTGGDWDLHYANQGNAIIISEDNDSDDADDNWNGGTLTFSFDEVSDVTSVTMLDVEETGGSIELFDTEGATLGNVAIPAGENNGIQEVDVNVAGVSTMVVTLAGSGAVDDVCFATPDAGDCGEYAVNYDDLFQPPQMVEDEHPEEHPDDILDVA